MLLFEPLYQVTVVTPCGRDIVWPPMVMVFEPAAVTIEPTLMVEAGIVLVK